MPKLKGHHVLRGVLTCVTGLHIGISRESIEIGGTDNPIVRHPITRLPYVPGSSLKGKIRSLLELSKCAKEVMKDGKPCGCGKAECDVCRVLGCGQAKRTESPTRAIFRDCQLTQDSRRILEEAYEKLGLDYAGVKAEVTIDRRTGKAHEMGPRSREVVPEGIQFDVEVVLRVFEGDNVEKDVSVIKNGFEMLKNDTLGGSGSRGYGKVSVEWTNEADVAYE